MTALLDPGSSPYHQASIYAQETAAHYQQHHQHHATQTSKHNLTIVPDIPLPRIPIRLRPPINNTPRKNSNRNFRVIDANTYIAPGGGAGLGNDGDLPSQQQQFMRPWAYPARIGEPAGFIPVNNAREAMSSQANGRESKDDYSAHSHIPNEIPQNSLAFNSGHTVSPYDHRRHFDGNQDRDGFRHQPVASERFIPLPSMAPPRDISRPTPPPLPQGPLPDLPGNIVDNTNLITLKEKKTLSPTTLALQGQDSSLSSTLTYYSRDSQAYPEPLSPLEGLDEEYYNPRPSAPQKVPINGHGFVHQLPRTPSHSSHPSISDVEGDKEEYDKDQVNFLGKKREPSIIAPGTITSHPELQAIGNEKRNANKFQSTNPAPPLATDFSVRANSMDMAFENRLYWQKSSSRAYLAYRVESQVIPPIEDEGTDDAQDGTVRPRWRGYRVPSPEENPWGEHPLAKLAENNDPLKQSPPPSRKDQTSQQPEPGYDGDNDDEGVRIAKHHPLRRRNTVAGDIIMSAPSAKRRVNHAVQTNMDDDRIDWSQARLKVRKSHRASRRKSGNNPMAFGTRISEGHTNYMLMYNMLTGIRISVSRCSAKPDRPVVRDDYMAANKYSFDIVGDEMTPVAHYDFKFKDYAPWVFRHIREAFHLESSDYLVSLTDKYIMSEIGSSGKSGSFFYYSQDFRFIIKTVHHTEHKFMRKILSNYYEYVSQNPNTLLSRIYGLHRIKTPEGKKVHFIVMSNIFPPNKDIHIQYDLKGSMLGRELSPEAAAKPRACLKDKNWLNNKCKLQLGPQKRRQFVEQLIRDVGLLIKLKIMDYSLLIGVHDVRLGNQSRIRDATLSVFDPEKTELPPKALKQANRANTIRDKVSRTDPVVIDNLPEKQQSSLLQPVFHEQHHSIFYRDDGGIFATNDLDRNTNLIYYLGVIDILTPYNTVKRVEHIAKSVRYDRHTISAVNPRYYGLRFLRFMVDALSDPDDVKDLLQRFEESVGSSSSHGFHWF
ncbi:Phosphatidylinositol-4-phosphate 5-kinase [Mycoemilia scoparia]|uniref:Phosphatidylinositol-4-phosphate 5-kinase n=1 Tax=Mycoemilia scoparia TaxID=417184 RepID=A0A9W8DRH4_9FUNG|nr:Phosphatidylinositol-4-phosphate 5-kinase [Mycoemilia scoparia]